MTGTRWRPRPRLGWCVLATAALLAGAQAECPWQASPALQAACICALNLAHELSVQCDQVNFKELLTALDSKARNIPIDLLYINNSTIPLLDDDIFINLKIHNVQISGCKIKRISDDAFRGQGPYMKNLNLQDNELIEVPVQALQILTNLALLDFSKNRISFIDNNSFATLRKLTTLKLSDNNVTLAAHALAGLENSLKNLNLKGTKQKRVPDCIRGLRNLAFLDLSQNSIRELPGKGGELTFEGLEALTALNLERNVIHSLGENSFAGIKKTLSSLSLLNNLLPEFPTAAISTLSELRVLDIGFNLLNTLPSEAFLDNPSITLLALDGNPLSTVPEKALAHLNTTLRGLSLGGRFLKCDCRLRWVTEWIRNGDLQVTSRERNPQFCGDPPRFRDRGFYSLEPEELTCDTNGIAGVATAVEDDSLNPIKDNNKWKASITERSSTSPPATTTTTTTEASTRPSPTTTTTTTTTTVRPTRAPTARPAPPTWRHAPQQRPPLVMSYPQQKSKVDDSNEVIVKNAYRQDNSVVIQWDSDVANILGFRVVYRLFGDKSFKQGPPLEASEREFKIKNVPSQECVVVCVISLEEVHVSPESVPYGQCREVRTVSAAASNMDMIVFQECIVVCVISLEEVHVSPESVPYGQCREVRTVSAAASNMDMIVFQECIVVCVISLEEVHVSPESVPYGQCREVRTVSAAASNMDMIVFQECIVVCVISLEEVHVSPESVPYGQCREVRTVSAAASNMDMIVFQECIVVCVISLEEVHVSPESVPYGQCREVRTVSAAASNMDMIVFQECIVVCVISLEEVHVSPESVPYGQCREVRTVSAAASNMDMIVFQECIVVCVISLEEVHVSPESVPYGQCREVRTVSAAASNMDMIVFQECIVVCVISLEEVHVSPESVPYGQCREVRTVSAAASNMDMIVFQECIVVCVISLEEVHVSPESVPYGQCREVRTVSAAASNMDMIVFQECIVVCVISLEEVHVSPESVPYGQCREVRTVSAAASNMDMIVFQECIVVCVISLEEVHVSPESVPYGQCREVRTVSAAASNMDMIVFQECIVVCVISLEEVHVSPESVPYGQCREVRTVSAAASNMDMIVFQECIVVCVISLEEVHVSPESVPYGQCREVRTVSAAASNMDKITIAASAAICGTIVVAVLVFAAASRRRSRTVHRLHARQLDKMPGTCCGALAGTPSPGGPLSSLATMGAFGKQREWDQVSAYSARSIPRARTYAEPPPPEALPGRPGRARSLADGQSQHSYSAHSARYGVANPGYPGSLLGSRSDLRQSRQSLTAASERASRLSLSGAAGGAGSGAGAGGSGTAGSRRRPRSRSRPASRYSVGSLGLGYCDTSDNWTDHDMDIYMARNATARGGLVPL